MRTALGLASLLIAAPAFATEDPPLALSQRTELTDILFCTSADAATAVAKAMNAARPERQLDAQGKLSFIYPPGHPAMTLLGGYMKGGVCQMLQGQAQIFPVALTLNGQTNGPGMNVVEAVLQSRYASRTIYLLTDRAVTRD